jgi:gamma-glutamyltranspeptidase / glutathione hydrolase
VHTRRATRVLDFFVTVPSGDRPEPEEVTIVFDGTQTQVFRVGKGTCAVPGNAAGLEEAHRGYGTLPWRDVVLPAAELARAGLDVTPGQAFLHEILAPVLVDTPAHGLAAGARLVAGELADTLERIARRGARALYDGELARAVTRHVPAITSADLAAYRPIWRHPVRAPYRGHEFVSNPPPSSGGVLIAYGLGQLEDPGAPGTPDAVARLARVMDAQQRARERRLTRKLAVGGTTHISVVDAAGNAASLSASTGGGGSGVVVPGTGVHMNNMLGEYDLMIRSPRPGQRLTSMMAPSLALAERTPRLVLGSAGSNRLRGAIMQITVNVLAHGMGVADAVAAPRVHYEAGQLHVEPPLEPPPGEWEPVRWREQNLFFGGVAAVETLPDGSLAAAGDPRRGGAGIVVT